MALRHPRARSATRRRLAPAAQRCLVEAVESRALLSTTTLAPLADAYVRDGTYASQNFGTAADLVVKGSPTSGNTRRTYLKFDLGTLSNIDNVTLRLRGAATASSPSVAIGAYGVSNTSWGESTITWNNKPALTGSVLDSETVSGTIDQWYEWDVTSYAQAARAANQSVVTLAIEPGSSSTANPTAEFDAREGAFDPRLVVTTTPTPTPTTTLTPVADAYVRDGTYASQNFGTAADLVVKGSPTSGNTRLSYLKFDLGTLSNIGNVTLRLRGAATAASPSVALEAYGVSNTSWGESTITWNNKPSLTGSVLDTETVSGATDQWYEWDVTSFVQSEKAANRSVVTLAIDPGSFSTSNPTAEFDAREGTYDPQLVVTTTPTPTPTIAISDRSQVEGNSGLTSFQFTATRTGDLGGTNAATYTVTPGTASSSDVQVTTGTVSFGPGETTKSIAVNVVGDTTVESDETFTVALSGPTGGAVLGDATGLGTIVNDDTADPGQPTSILISDQSRTEGDSGLRQFQFAVTRAGAVSGMNAVSYTVTPGTAGSSDVQLTTGTVTFAPGETTKYVIANVIGDTAVETDETFSVVLSNPTGGAVLAGATGQGTIIDDDGPNSPTLPAPQPLPGSQTQVVSGGFNVLTNVTGYIEWNGTIANWGVGGVWLPKFDESLGTLTGVTVGLDSSGGTEWDLSWQGGYGMVLGNGIGYYVPGIPYGIDNDNWFWYEGLNPLTKSTVRYTPAYGAAFGFAAGSFFDTIDESLTIPQHAIGLYNGGGSIFITAEVAAGSVGDHASEGVYQGNHTGTVTITYTYTPN